MIEVKFETMIFGRIINVEAAILQPEPGVPHHEVYDFRLSDMDDLPLPNSTMKLLDKETFSRIMAEALEEMKQ